MGVRWLFPSSHSQHVNHSWTDPILSRSLTGWKDATYAPEHGVGSGASTIIISSLTVISSGNCTHWATVRDVGFRNALTSI